MGHKGSQKAPSTKINLVLCLQNLNISLQILYIFIDVRPLPTTEGNTGSDALADKCFNFFIRQQMALPFAAITGQFYTFLRKMAACCVREQQSRQCVWKNKSIDSHLRRVMYGGNVLHRNVLSGIDVCISLRLFISALLVVNALLLSADNIHFPSLSLPLLCQLRPERLFCLVEHFLAQNAPFLKITFHFCDTLSYSRCLIGTCFAGSIFQTHRF